MFHMVAERGDGPRRVRSRGDRGREGRGVDRNREDRERSRGGDRDDKTKVDDYRRLAESATRDAKYKAAKDACVAYAEASKMQIACCGGSPDPVPGGGQTRDSSAGRDTGGCQAGSRAAALRSDCEATVSGSSGHELGEDVRFRSLQHSVLLV